MYPVTGKKQNKACSTITNRQSTSLYDWAIQDWIASGVDREYADRLCQTLEGQRALDRLLYSDNLSRTQSGGRILSSTILKRYRHTEDGGWWLPTLDPATEWEEESLWGCFKPLNPRTNKEGNPIKYEHPPKEPTQVFYLPVTDRIWQRVSKRYGVAIEGSNFWQWVRNHPAIPLYITEGAKKAASLLSRGYPAIALPGVWNWKEGDSLKPCLSAIGFGDRTVTIAFDYDPKQSTQRSVGSAAFKLFLALKQAGAKPQYLQIPPGTKGSKQGIDDYFVATGDDDLKGCQLSTDSLYPRNLWGLSQQPNLTIDKRYIGSLKGQIPDSGLVIIKAPTGTGKTFSIEEIVTSYANAGKRVLIISNRITTGRALAHRFGIPYIDDKDDPMRLLGYAICIESCKPFGKAGIKVTRVKDGEPLDSEWLDDCVVILDEFDQTLFQLLNSSTCRNDRGHILSCFEGLMQDILCRSDGLVVAMSADISDIDIGFLTGLCLKINYPISPYLITNTYRTHYKYDMFSYKSQADVYRKACEMLQNKPDNKCLFFSVEGQRHKSKWGTQTIENKLRKAFPKLRILRVDAVTLSDPEHPAYGCIEKLNLMAQYFDVILASPSISSAVSLEDYGVWEAVCDISAGLSSTREWRQRLDRVREGVARHVYVPGKAKPLANGATSYKKVKAGKSRQVQALIGVLDRADMLVSGERDCERKIDPLCFRTWAKQIARFNSDAYRYREACLELAASEGVKIYHPDGLEREEIAAINSEFKSERDSQWQQHCEARANAADISPEKAERLEREHSKYEDDRLALEKYQIREQIGGIDPTPEIVKKVDSGWLPQLRLHFALTYTKFTNERDSERLQKLAAKPNLHAPDIRGNSAKIALLKLLGVDRLLDPDKEWSADSPEVQRIATLARGDKQTIKDILGITIGNSSIEICQSLLKLMGLHLTLTGRRRIDGKRVRFYRYVPPEDERWDIFDRWVDRETDRRQKRSSDLVGQDAGSRSKMPKTPPQSGEQGFCEIHDCPTKSINRSIRTASGTDVGGTTVSGTTVSGTETGEGSAD